MTENSIDKQKQTEDEALREHINARSREVLKRLPAMGPILMLYMQSSHRRHHFISDLEWLLLPPLVNKQCKLYMKDKYPISFASWAFLSEAAEKRLFENGGRLRPDDWNSGNSLWIVDIVAPFGGIENMLEDIRKNEFPDQVVHLVVPDPKTGGITAREMAPFQKNRNKKNRK